MPLTLRAIEVQVISNDEEGGEESGMNIAI
jgi:hypothetical protein